MQKEIARYKWVLFVTELFNIVAIDFDAMKTTCYSQVLLVTALVVSGTQCNFCSAFVIVGYDVVDQIFDHNKFEELKTWQKE